MSYQFQILSSQFWESIFSRHIASFSLEYLGKHLTLRLITTDKEHIAETNTNPLSAIEKDEPSVVEETMENNPFSTINTFENELTPTLLNPAYTFENFITGPGNQMAHVAAISVASQPGLMYNPCMIYGGSGLGKTHLMHAIGNEIKRNNPNARIRYSTIENFMNDYITSIQTKQQHEFRKKYREIDVLLIDDIQFLTKNKEGTKEEFFHTFNALYQHNKQIVLTCDRKPSTIEGLEDRLVSRFNMGLSTDITPPDFETRIAILRKKADKEDFTDSALAYIANHVSNNVRELEGALYNIKIYAITYGVPIITEEVAAKALSEQAHESKNSNRNISLKDIMIQVSEFYQVKIDDLIGKKRKKEIVHPRQIAMYLARELTDISFPKIGEEFGKRNHTTVMHAYEKVKEELEQSESMRQDVEKLKKDITQ